MISPSASTDPGTTTTTPISTAAIREEYERDGVVCVRGLIDTNLLDALDQASIEQPNRPPNRKKKRSQFYTEEHSVLLENPAFLHLGTSGKGSRVAQVATELLHLNNSDWDPEDGTTTTRIVRDILLAKDDEQFVCGWHTDDLGFWPATPDSPGINAWIALDDMENVTETGGFALAVQSDRAIWKEAAWFATGASAANFPSGGYTSAADLLTRRTGQGTCNLQRAAPHIHQRMEETARIYPVRRGDVVFHTRWLFHRTVAVGQPTDRVYRRYSVRYGPGATTILPPGYGTELSILWDPSNGGRSLEEVVNKDGPWYPQAWPPLREAEWSSFETDLHTLQKDKLPVAMERRKERINEIKRESMKPRHHRQDGSTRVKP